MAPIPTDPDIVRLKKALIRAASINGPEEIALMRQVANRIANGAITEAVVLAGSSIISVYYRLWGDKGSNLGITSLEDAFMRLSRNPSILADLDEIFSWAEEETPVSGMRPELPFACLFELHAQYGSTDILAALGQATLESAGQRGRHLSFSKYQGICLSGHFSENRARVSPSTMYVDYPVSRELLHWESQSTTTQQSDTGQNLIHHEQRDYTILIFARDLKKRNGCTVPFTYLGSADLDRYE